MEPVIPPATPAPMARAETSQTATGTARRERDPRVGTGDKEKGGRMREL